MSGNKSVSKACGREHGCHDWSRISATRWRILLACLVLVSLASAGVGFDENSLPQHAPAVTPLADLLRETAQNNPRIQAAWQAWKAAQQIPSQVSTRPDPEFQIQQLNVGSPRPFAGYTNSNFAYLGLGVSQGLPYPGKLRLKGDIARRDVDVLQQQYESVRRSLLAQLKGAYFQLAYLSKALAILQSDGELLDQAEKAADARYRSGMGTQQDLLRAQLERTQLLREITLRHLEAARLQAQVKQLANRSPASPDIAPAPLAETPLPYTYDELLAAAKAQNPEIASAEQMVKKEGLKVDLAHKDFYPDFNVQYMWQRTDPFRYRAYYMLTFGVRVPIYRSRKQRPELAEAEAELSRSRNEFEARSQAIAAELRVEYDTARETAELLKIYNEGLLPQARAEFQAGIASYQNNRQDFQSLLASFLDVLHVDEEYWKNAAERETALAQIEQLTGLTLRKEGATK